MRSGVARSTTGVQSGQWSAPGRPCVHQVTIPGSVVQWEGIELTAERSTDRRHTIQTVLASLVGDDEDQAAEAAAKLAEESAGRSS